MNVAFFIFRRPDLTQRVFEAIAAAKPSRLLVVADGPRNEQDAPLCEASRRVVMEGVSWPCEVLTNFAKENMGCKHRMSSGLEWVFDSVEDAIILEDDCLPHFSFFPFCAELLERYRDNERVGSIAGEHGYCIRERLPYSYFFSRYGSIWGWASWRRAWRHYDVAMAQWPALRDVGWLNKYVYSDAQARRLAHLFDHIHSGAVDTWDIQLGFSRLVAEQWSIVPSVNLVSNIGFGPQASRTVQDYGNVGCRQVVPMSFPLRHPEAVHLRDDYDRRLLIQDAERRPAWFRKFIIAVLNVQKYRNAARKLFVSRLLRAVGERGGR